MVKMRIMNLAKKRPTVREMRIKNWNNGESRNRGCPGRGPSRENKENITEETEKEP
jgi:hypothetical protein